jgi:hypothetical protein
MATQLRRHGSRTVIRSPRDNSPASAQRAMHMGQAAASGELHLEHGAGARARDMLSR